ncbi:MAG: hypothetical protein MUC49_17750 [Raineya sp.]|jgi:hypothetical protein|nr:hypothetical protein [Raineya sp.]
METLIFKRPYEKFNKYCSYAIFINGEKIGELQNGEEKHIEMDNFLNKEIEVKIGWCGSGKRKIKGSHLIIEGNSFLNQKIPVLGGIFPLIGLLLIRNQEGFSKFLGTSILALFLFGLLMTITLFRKKWVYIKELNIMQ